MSLDMPWVCSHLGSCWTWWFLRDRGGPSRPSLCSVFRHGVLGRGQVSCSGGFYLGLPLEGGGVREKIYFYCKNLLEMLDKNRVILSALEGEKCAVRLAFS